MVRRVKIFRVAESYQERRYIFQGTPLLRTTRRLWCRPRPRAAPTAPRLTSPRGITLSAHW
jgi:hypothetical protein